MITVNRQWQPNGQLKSVAIATSGGEQAVITWDKHGEATLLYGHNGQKQNRVVGIKEFEMGDGDGRILRANVVEVRGQRIIKKTNSSLILDGDEMPEDQKVFDLNKGYASRSEKMATDAVIAQVMVGNKDEVQMRKMAILGKLLDLQPEDVRQVVSYAQYLKNMRENG